MRIHIKLKNDEDGHDSQYEGRQSFVTATHRYGIFRFTRFDKPVNPTTWLEYKIPLNPEGSEVWTWCGPIATMDTDLYRIANPSLSRATK